jgi:hypothetical protein
LGNHEDYREEWYGKTMKMAKVQILTPHPEGVKLDTLKNGPMQFPDKKWSGENDMEQFWKWYMELLGFLALRGCKGPQYDEVHLDNLIQGLGEPALSLGVKLQDEALLNKEEEKFFYVLDVLIRTYIKASAMVNMTKKFWSIKFDANKGLSQFYQELEKTASEMVTPSDRAMFNARFINGTPPKWKREIIAHDRIRVDFSSPQEMRGAASRVDKVIDGLKIASAYRSGSYTQYTQDTMTTSHEKPAYHAGRTSCQGGTKPQSSNRRKKEESKISPTL